MSIPITKATPRAILLGVRDESTRQLPLETEQLPQHLPLLFLLTEKSEEMSIVSGGAIHQLYGSKTLDPNSAYFNHQTVMAETILGRGNQVMVKPIKLPSAKKATLRLSVETIATMIQDPSDTTGIAKKLVTRVIWHADRVDAALTGNGLGQGSVLAAYRDGAETSSISGTMLSELVTGTATTYHATSSLVPILDLQVDARGEFGNRFGITLEAPLDSDAFPTDQSLAASLKSFIYRLKLFQRPESSSTAQVIYNNFSANSTDFVLKPHTSNPASGAQVSLQDVIVDMYQEAGDAESMPRIAPFPNVYIYQDNIEAVATLIAAGYKVEGKDSADAVYTFNVPGLYSTEEQVRENLYNVNIFTGTNTLGTTYSNVDYQDSVKFAGIRLGKDSIIYAAGGSDGIPYKNGAIDRLETTRLYDEAVRDWCTTEFVEANPVFDSAKYPFSTLHDSGFSMKTKLAMLQPMGLHKRIWVNLATHSVADYLDPEAVNKRFITQKQLSGSEEVARASALRAAASVFPESEVYGTPVVRAIIVAHSGLLRSKRVRDFLPLTLAVADKVSAYCGAGNGIWNSDYAFDDGDNKRETMFTKVNNTYQSRAVYNKSWDAGMIWVQNYDRQSLFFPAYQTAYPNDTSVLNSLTVLIAVCYLERVCEIVWRKLTGNGRYENAQFLERSNELILDETRGRFDNRFTIVPNTMYTKADEARGYSWSTEIAIYANNSRTVGTFTIVAKRASDLI